VIIVIAMPTVSMPVTPFARPIVIIIAAKYKHSESARDMPKPKSHAALAKPAFGFANLYTPGHIGRRQHPILYGRTRQVRRVLYHRQRLLSRMTFPHHQHSSQSSGGQTNDQN
jgi:hypothetical protein